MWISRDEYRRLLQRITDLEDARRKDWGAIKERLDLLAEKQGLEFYTEPSVPQKLTLITKKEAKKKRASTPYAGLARFFNVGAGLAQPLQQQRIF